MQRMLPVAAVRVVSAVSDGLRIEDSLEDDSGIIDEDVGVDSVDLDDDDESESDSDGSVPISARVARFLDSGKPAGPRKRKRAKLNHLSSEQKVERRKILNRIAAQTARDRKKVQMDELEQFVKELASENLRLARENAELRQKSTEFESENAKLRTQLERSGHPRTSTLKQEPMSIVQYTADSLKDSDSKPVSLIGARPIGIAARVGDVNVKMAESADTSMEMGWTSDSRAVLNRSQAEAKRSRLTATTECNKVTQNGVSEAVQRNAAAAVFVRTPRASAIQRPVRAPGRRIPQRVAVSRTVDGSQCPQLPTRCSIAASRPLADRFEGDASRLGNGNGATWSDRQVAAVARCTRCVSDCAHRGAARSNLASQAARRCAHASNCRMHVAPASQVATHDQVFSVPLDDDTSFSGNGDGSVLTESLSSTTIYGSSLEQDDMKAFLSSSGNETDLIGNDMALLNGEVVIPSSAPSLPLQLDGGQIVDDFLSLFAHEAGNKSYECGTTTGTRSGMEELFEELVADLEFN